jgi:hypothetical protein
MNWGRADTAVSYDHRGHSLGKLRGHLRSLNHACIVVCVNVDKTGREYHATSVDDFAGAVAERRADVANAIPANRNVEDLSRIPAAINDVRVAYQNVTRIHSGWFKL